MQWEPVALEALYDEILAAEEKMQGELWRFWQLIQIFPEKWQQTPYGDEGGGFWVVGVMGKQIIWYNDIEEGFNLSFYEQYGTIRDYWCNQDELAWPVQALLKSNWAEAVMLKQDRRRKSGSKRSAGRVASSPRKRWLRQIRVTFVFPTGPSMAAFFKKYWWVLSFGGLLWLGGAYYAVTSNQDAYETLFRTAVAGKIHAVEITNRGFAVRVTLTDSHRYRFFPAKQAGGASGFMAMAAVGDSLRKPPLSNTLVLVKKNRVMRYTFKKVLY